MDGFLIINKGKEWTSHDVVAKTRSILQTKKIGHLGTLDPLATGVLVLAVGKATKLVEYLMGCDKQYEATIHLGAVSTTYDAEGEITKREAQQPSKEEAEKAVASFQGEIQQVPPIYSAIKINGTKAYSLARKGKEIEMKPRKITIHEIKVTKYEWPYIKLTIHCSTGTYIRSLAFDIGEKLSCGGYLEDLKRTKLQNITLQEAIEIEDISKENIHPIESFLPPFPRVELSDEDQENIQHGKTIDSNNEYQDEENILGMKDGKLIAILTYKKKLHQLAPNKLIKPIQ